MLLFLITIRNDYFYKKLLYLRCWLVLASSSYNTVKCDIKSLSDMVGNADAFKVSEAYELFTQF